MPSKEKRKQGVGTSCSGICTEGRKEQKSPITRSGHAHGERKTRGSDHRAGSPSKEGRPEDRTAGSTDDQEPYEEVRVWGEQ